MNDGGPAFPIGDVHPNHADQVVQGMSLRDYFAAKVLQAIRINGPQWKSHEVAKWAYQDADAMLKARTNGEQGEEKNGN